MTVYDFPVFCMMVNRGSPGEVFASRENYLINLNKLITGTSFITFRFFFKKLEALR